MSELMRQGQNPNIYNQNSRLNAIQHPWVPAPGIHPEYSIQVVKENIRWLIGSHADCIPGFLAAINKRALPVISVQDSLLSRMVLCPGPCILVGISFSDADPDLWIQICIIKVGSGY